jgi:hypothetical protein
MVCAPGTTRRHGVAGHARVAAGLTYAAGHARRWCPSA